MYDIYEHRHRVAVWGAGRAYSRQGPGHTIAVARTLIETSGLGKISTPDQLPAVERIDQFIHERIEAVMDAARPLRFERHKGDKPTIEALVCTYGRAQKLVNMYLKLKLICAGHHEDSRVNALHPPLDFILLKALFVSKDVDQHSDLGAFETALKKARALGSAWTQFDRTTYDAYIAAIRVFQGSQPLWAVERLWNPERD